MNTKILPYHVVDFPPERRVMPDFLDLVRDGTCMYGLAGGGRNGPQAVHRRATKQKPESSCPSPVT